MKHFLSALPTPSSLAKLLNTKNVLLAVFGVGWVVGLLIVMWGGYYLLQITQHPQIDTLPTPVPAPQLGNITIDIAGAVQNPGVYSLSLGARMAEAIQAAGGLSASASAQFIQQQLNLASKLQDTDKIYIPFADDALIAANNQSQNTVTMQDTAFCDFVSATSQVAANTNDSSPLSSTSVSGLININTASQKELETLTGVGEKRAADIIANRPYIAVSELVTKAGLSENLLAELATQITY